MARWTQHAFFLPAADFGVDDHLIMPVIPLSLLPIAYTARLTRASTLDTIRQDYVRTAWAKGLSERIVVLKHVLKNSLIPVVTTLGPTFAFLVTGSVIVETVFNIPGIGRAFVVAVTSRDYPMILGTTLLFSVVIAVANLVVAALYVFIDPRVRLMYGRWISLSVGILVQGISLPIGLAIGLTAGYFGGRIDNLLMRITDIWYAFPDLIFVLVLVSVFGPSLLSIFGAIALVNWVNLARLVRGQVLSIKEKEFIEAARASGSPPIKLIVKHLLPNSLGPIIESTWPRTSRARFTQLTRAMAPKM